MLLPALLCIFYATLEEPAQVLLAYPKALVNISYSLISHHHALVWYKDYHYPRKGRRFILIALGIDEDQHQLRPGVSNKSLMFPYVKMLHQNETLPTELPGQPANVVYSF